MSLPVLWPEVEADVDVFPHVAVGALVPGEPSDHVSAEFHALGEQRRAARVADDALLGEGDDLHKCLAVETALQLKTALDGDGAADRVDVSEHPHRGRPVYDSLLDDRGGTVRDLLGACSRACGPR